MIHTCLHLFKLEWKFVILFIRGSKKKDAPKIGLCTSINISFERETKITFLSVSWTSQWRRVKKKEPNAFRSVIFFFQSRCLLVPVCIHSTKLCTTMSSRSDLAIVSRYIPNCVLLCIFDSSLLISPYAHNAAAYSRRWREGRPKLPILLASDGFRNHRHYLRPRGWGGPVITELSELSNPELLTSLFSGRPQPVNC